MQLPKITTNGDFFTATLSSIDNPTILPTAITVFAYKISVVPVFVEPTSNPQFSLA
jgi:hypothetical protein